MSRGPGLRVIAGTLRGRLIRSPRGLEVRPTGDRLREALFSSLGDRVVDARVWDACAGTGALGIEALSRGAATATFSEPAPPAAEVIRGNLDELGLVDRAQLHRMGWERAIELLAAAGPCLDLVFFDPPWGLGLGDPFLAAVPRVVAAGGMVVVEHPTGKGPAPPSIASGLTRNRVLNAGGAAVSLFVMARAAG